MILEQLEGAVGRQELETMPVPKRKTSHSKRNKRRAHDSISVVATIECAECGERMVRHRACPHCGLYRGRKVIEIDD